MHSECIIPTLHLSVVSNIFFSPFSLHSYYGFCFQSCRRAGRLLFYCTLAVLCQYSCAYYGVMLAPATPTNVVIINQRQNRESNLEYQAIVLSQCVHVGAPLQPYLANSVFTGSCIHGCHVFFFFFLFYRCFCRTLVFNLDQEESTDTAPTCLKVTCPLWNMFCNACTHAPMYLVQAPSVDSVKHCMYRLDLSECILELMLVGNGRQNLVIKHNTCNSNDLYLLLQPVPHAASI